MTDYLLVDISLSGMLSVVMVNDYSDIQHNYFCLTEKCGLLNFNGLMVKKDKVNIKYN